ncbi:MAG: hypothetical protein H6853_07260 [Rhodospirillales bacterium]|nr:hypothetical protein [Alphaproteobacteria bacterium]USO03327.1 MAG: hypothetical protein H6853_07260 [Rhodospirillales bacterium]
MVDQTKKPNLSSGYMTAREWNGSVGWGTVPKERDAERPENQDRIERLKKQEAKTALRLSV